MFFCASSLLMILVMLLLCKLETFMDSVGVLYLTCEKAATFRGYFSAELLSCDAQDEATLQARGCVEIVMLVCVETLSCAAQRQGLLSKSRMCAFAFVHTVQDIQMSRLVP